MPSELAGQWILDPAVDFLNHGSFGATPRPVLDAQQAWRERMEAEPTRFFAEELEPALDAARDRLAAFLSADPQASPGCRTPPPASTLCCARCASSPATSC